MLQGNKCNLDLRALIFRPPTKYFFIIVAVFIYPTDVLSSSLCFKLFASKVSIISKDVLDSFKNN